MKKKKKSNKKLSFEEMIENWKKESSETLNNINRKQNVFKKRRCEND